MSDFSNAPGGGWRGRGGVILLVPFLIPYGYGAEKGAVDSDVSGGWIGRLTGIEQLNKVEKWCQGNEKQDQSGAKGPHYATPNPRFWYFVVRGYPPTISKILKNCAHKLVASTS